MKTNKQNKIKIKQRTNETNEKKLSKKNRKKQNKGTIRLNEGES
jgi:hypothetical protein